MSKGPLMQFRNMKEKLCLVNKFLAEQTEQENSVNCGKRKIEDDQFLRNIEEHDEEFCTDISNKFQLEYVSLCEEIKAEWKFKAYMYWSIGDLLKKSMILSASESITAKESLIISYSLLVEMLSLAKITLMSDDEWQFFVRGYTVKSLHCLAKYNVFIRPIGAMILSYLNGTVDNTVKTATPNGRNIPRDELSVLIAETTREIVNGFVMKLWNCVAVTNEAPNLLL